MRTPAERVAEVVRSAAAHVPAEGVAGAVRSAAGRVPTDRIDERLGRRRRGRRRPSLLLVAAVAGAAGALVALAVARTLARRSFWLGADGPPRTDPDEMATAEPGHDAGVLGVDLEGDGDLVGRRGRASG